MSSWDDIGSGVGAGSGLMGMFSSNTNQKRQYGQTKNLMGLQNQYQRGLNQQGHDLQMDMWNKTNYKAQLEHMKAAGLNPALMYGMGGGGGSTTGSQGGGSQNMGGVEQQKNMGIEGAMAMAQMANLAAQTQKTKEDARDKKYENDRREMHEDQDYNAYGKDLDNRIISGEKQNAQWEWEKAMQYEMSTKDTGGVTNSDTNKSRKYVAEVLGAELELKLKESKTNLTEEQANEIYHKIINAYLKNGINAVQAIIGASIGGKLSNKVAKSLNGNARMR